MLRIYDTASRSLEDVTPITPGHIGMYACGPTVYQRAHVGNLRAYVMEDILRRTLERHGLAVKHVMNITDVGHLTDDADEGEDKLERAARQSSESAWDIARRFTDAFTEDMKRLDILAPTAMPRATDNIQIQIDLIAELERKGFAYKTSDGIYFDTSKFEGYGRLSGQALTEKEEGSRVAANAEKRNPTDFALWKFSTEGEKRQMEWESPWGIGFPGWHVECSAMSRKELGQPFDIHCGGVDHIPVHHENEIAQSEAAYGAKLANLWFHVEFLLVDGQKMSKSLGNTYSLDDLKEHGFDAMSYRYFLLCAHYRQKQNFTWEALQASQNAMKKLRQTVRDWKTPLIGCADLEAEFLAAMDDDLNTPRALAILWKTVDSDHPSEAKAETLLMMDKVLGLGLADVIAKPTAIPEDIQALLNERKAARDASDWKESDRLRDEIANRGWTVEDTAAGQKATPRG
ncbi:MAG: cysteine--tRNA ligase [Patescibacteria group bacterium]